MEKRKVNYTSISAYDEISDFMKNYLTKDPVIICIGTDKCVGDCLGPLVGTFLRENHFPIPVYGTLENPIHALNLKKKLSEIYDLHPNASIIGIDACLGDTKSIGEIHCRDYAIHPGKGVGKSLPDVGIASIIGIVDSSDNPEMFVTRSIRLFLVFEMAKVITKGLIDGYNLSCRINKQI